MDYLNDIQNEANEYSSYQGDELGYTGQELENGYFMQGGAEVALQNVLEPLNRTLTFRVVSTAMATATAILFNGNVEPLVQPAGITVTVLESSHEQVRQESKSNPFAIQGLRYFVQNATQFQNPLTITKQYPTGKSISYLWQPTNFISPTNLNPLLIDAPDFGVVVDGKTRIEVPTNSMEDLTLTFTLKAATANSHSLFGKGVKELATAPRMTGNPIADIQLARPRLG